jgi:Mlc titration factor MtfA (ptsG expression regulator)
MNIKIGPQNYVVEQRSRQNDGMLNDGSYGYTLDTGNIIIIDKDIAKSKQQVTLLHEILHAIRFNNDILPKPKKKDEFDDWEHYFIGLYEGNLLAVLKDNPELVEWLTVE